jgi:hypothetical protein
VRAWPTVSDTPPLNTTVRVVVPSQALAAKPDDIQLTWRERWTKKRATVDADRAVITSGDETIIVLTPKKPLTAATAYEVLLGTPGKNPAQITVFTTSKVADTTAPTWEGVKVSKWLTDGGMCSTGQPFAQLGLGKASDDQTATGSLVYEVWLGDGLGKIDYRTPPTTVVTDIDGLLELGDPSKCLPSTLAFPDGAKKLHVGVRPVDLAGNVGDPSELDLVLAVATK